MRHGWWELCWTEDGRPGWAMAVEAAAAGDGPGAGGQPWPNIARMDEMTRPAGGPMGESGPEAVRVQSGGLEGEARKKCARIHLRPARARSRDRVPRACIGSGMPQRCSLFLFCGIRKYCISCSRTARSRSSSCSGKRVASQEKGVSPSVEGGASNMRCADGAKKGGLAWRT